jgi:hypothetical protein
MTVGPTLTSFSHTAGEQVASDSADVVISGQAFEHIQYFWITMLEIARAQDRRHLLHPRASSGPSIATR